MSKIQTPAIKKLKCTIVEAVAKAGEGHIPSAFSILDIVWTLYDKVLKFDPKNPKWDERDRFFLSKGHASLALYMVLSEKKFFPRERLEGFAKWDSLLGGHPDRNKVPGVEASTGSLGHGLPMAVGSALASKISGVKYRVFTIIGDGEANEGTIWESAMLASHHKLNNLYCIVDYNHSGDRALRVDDLVEKFKSFGWQSISVDGHNQKEIEKALKVKTTDKPIAIIAETIKGLGAKMMENNPAWHHKAPTPEEFTQILKELS